MWDNAGGGCNVTVPNLPRREVGQAGVYWLALGPSARTSGGRSGTATLLPLLVAEGVLSHTLTFECVDSAVGKSRVLLHGSQPEPRATGVTRLGPDGVFLYVDLVLSSHCGLFRASVFLERSLLEHCETCALDR